VLTGRDGSLFAARALPGATHAVSNSKTGAFDGDSLWSSLVKVMWPLSIRKTGSASGDETGLNPHRQLLLLNLQTLNYPATAENCPIKSAGKHSSGL